MKLSRIALISLFSLHLIAADVSTQKLYDEALNRYNSGDFKTAYPLWENLSLNTPENIEFNFFLGQSALELKRYDEAITAFDRVLMLNPKHTRTHLELARLYFEQAQFEQARNELSLVMQEQLPDNVKGTVLAFKSKVDEHLSAHHFSGALIVGGGYDSNVNNDIGNKAFNIPSLNIPIYGNDKTSDKQLISTLILNHTYTFEELEAWSLEDSFQAYTKMNSKSSLNNIALFALSSAPTFKQEGIKFSLPIAFDKVYVDGKGYMHDLSASAKVSYLLNPFSQIEGGYTYKKGYFTDAQHDVDSNNFFASYKHIIGDNLFLLSLNTSYALNAEVQAIRTDVANTEFKYNASISKDFSNGLKGSLGYTAIATQYDDMDTLFETKRKDRTKQYELGLGYTIKSDFSLGASLACTQNDSNQDPFTYDKTMALLSMMYSF